MQVKVFADEGVLVRCKECFDVMLVPEDDTFRCPSCQHTNCLEVEDSTFEDGRATVKELEDDWFYEPVRQSGSAPISVVKSRERRLDEQSDGMQEEYDEKGKRLAPIIDMFSYFSK